ncbi:unnamed protein product [Symbiodinium sp. CCMP2592]|nr:unnamed protein product [Symbiodinium sp. CCMP2592]
MAAPDVSASSDPALSSNNVGLASGVAGVLLEKGPLSVGPIALEDGEPQLPVASESILASLEDAQGPGEELPGDVPSQPAEPVREEHLANYDFDEQEELEYYREYDNGFSEALRNLSADAEAEAALDRALHSLVGSEECMSEVTEQVSACSREADPVFVQEQVMNELVRHPVPPRGFQLPWERGPMKSIFADNLPSLPSLKGMPRRSMPEPPPVVIAPSLSPAAKLPSPSDPIFKLVVKVVKDVGYLERREELLQVGIRKLAINLELVGNAFVPPELLHQGQVDAESLEAAIGVRSQALESNAPTLHEQDQVPRMDVAWPRHEIDQTLCNKLQKAFSDPCNLALACFDEGSTTDLVEDALQGQYPPEKRRRLASKLHQWSLDVEPRVKREFTFRAGSLKMLATRVTVPKNDVGAEFDSLVSKNPQVGVRILEQALRQRRLGSDTSRQAREEISRRRWILELAKVIREAGFPAASRIDAMSNPEAAWVRAFGSRRAKTLKNRAVVWHKLAEWLQATYSVCWPQSAEVVLQYLEERHEISPLGKTVPGGVLSSLGLLEQVGQVDVPSRLSEDTLLIEGVRSWKVELEKDSAPVKQAPMFPVIILLACELVVCNTSADTWSRFYAFVILLQVWATLRVDDLQNINPASITLSQLGLKMTLDRTKTSGAGKHVGRLQAFVMRGISLSGFDWIGHGYRLLNSEALKFERDFLCVRFCGDRDTASQVFIDNEEGDLHAWLSSFAVQQNFELQMAEFDSAREPASDLSDPGFWDGLFSEIKSGSWDVVLLTPPASTFSRARNRHAGRNGPRPVRDITYPWGFPWLRNADRELVSVANFHVKQCLQAATFQAQAGGSWLLIHPEDLGVSSSGSHPASLWQLPEVRAIVSKECFSFALHLCHFGAPAQLSTRIAGNLAAWNHHGVQWPVFDSGGHYIGPLRPCQVHDHSSTVGWDGTAWRSAFSYPSVFCEFLARAVASGANSTFATDSAALPELPHAAEAFAREVIAKPSILACDIETMFSLLPHEPPHAGSQASSGTAFFTGACSLGGIAGLRANASKFPLATQVLCAFLHQVKPDFQYTSCALFKNVATQPHRDARNATGTNLIVPISSFKNGGIWCEDPAGKVPFHCEGVTRLGTCLEVASGPVILDARDRLHATLDWQGDRLVLIAYSVSQWHALSSHHKDFLSSLGFRLPVSGLASAGELKASKPTAQAVPSEVTTSRKVVPPLEVVPSSSKVVLSSPEVVSSGAVARLGAPQEGSTPGAPVLSVAPALPVSHEPLDAVGKYFNGEKVSKRQRTEDKTSW